MRRCDVGGDRAVYINITIKERKDAAWFKANLADEPNDPDKLPQIDG